MKDKANGKNKDNGKDLYIESTNTNTSFSQLPTDVPVKFSIKLGFTEQPSDAELDQLRDRLGIQVDIFSKDGKRSRIVEFSPAISRIEDEYFFETVLPSSDIDRERDTTFVVVDYCLRKKGSRAMEKVLNSEVYNAGPQLSMQQQQGHLVRSLQSISDQINDGQIDVNVLSSTAPKSPILVLFKRILDSTTEIGFDTYQAHIDRIFCAGGTNHEETRRLAKRRFLPFNDTDSYRVLKIATEAFLMAQLSKRAIGSDESEAGLLNHMSERNLQFSANDKNSLNELWGRYVKPKERANPGDGDIQAIPYLYLIRKKFKDLGIKKNWVDDTVENILRKKIVSDRFEEAEDTCIGVVQQRLQQPLFLELIWSYWQEEGMLMQTMNAISQRFQNVRAPGDRDPLAEMEVTHLLPLNNLLWGYIQDEQHRLSLQRRAYEYDHHYGFVLQGKAAPKLRSADPRSRFIEAFHGLLHLASQYYKDVTNKLTDPDPYPILNALREVHFVIAEGMHNQYGALPSTARIEMLMQQWILARPEFRQFLPGRAAVPYSEAWMDRVASMNKLKGWTDVSPMHFNYLATYGEQLLLSIRFVDWSDESRLPSDAALWTKYWRLQIQGYLHSYKVATGVDLGANTTTRRGDIDVRPPSFHLAKRLKQRSSQNGTSPARSNGRPLKTRSRTAAKKKNEF